MAIKICLTLAGLLMLSGQHGPSDLVRNPRLGSAAITRVDGRLQTGRILRVTDQFLAFQPDRQPFSCEDVPLSEIAGVRYLRSQAEPRAFSDVAGEVLLVAMLGPLFAADAIAEPFKRTPLKPLRGDWQASGPSQGDLTSSLEFKGDEVVYRTTTRKRGRWSVDRDMLHLAFAGEAEWMTAFHFECGELVLDNPVTMFRKWSNRGHATAPILGDWRVEHLWLNLKPDGSAIKQRFGVRKGTFQNSSTEVRMYWNDPNGPGGAEWTAPIAHRHIVVSIDGATTEYHYLKPSFVELDF